MFKEKRNSHPFSMWNSISTASELLKRVMGEEESVTSTGE